MNRRPWRQGWQGQAAGIMTAVLILAVGFCLIHVDHHVGADQGMCPDPCAMMMSSLAMVLLAGPLVSRYSPFDPFRSVYAVSLALLDPPPKAPSLA